MLVLSYLNRAEQEHTAFNARRLQRIVLYMGALIVTAQVFACFSYTWDTKLHTVKAYIAVGIFLPIALALMARVTRHRWTCTIITGIYSAILIALILILPLFPATPRLGPIYAPVTHFIPPRFPLLVILPAFALDLLWQRRTAINDMFNAVLSGIVFTSVFVAVQWPFASFLLSSASDNRFFGTRYIGFDDIYAPITAAYWQFQTPSHGMHLVLGLTIAAGFAAIGIYAGNAIGRWMSAVRR
jgi:ABC-type Fe3+-siderophore transport system permease subunit